MASQIHCRNTVHSDTSDLNLNLYNEHYLHITHTNFLRGRAEKTMKTLNHRAGQDFNSWPPKSIVGALSIQIHLILHLNLYNEHYLHITHTIFFVHGL
jgi:hypothetical protein